MQHLQEGMKSIFFFFPFVLLENMEDRMGGREKLCRENVNSLDGSQSPRNAILGKGYVACLDGTSGLRGCMEQYFDSSKIALQ